MKTLWLSTQAPATPACAGCRTAGAGTAAGRERAVRTAGADRLAAATIFKTQ
ncbi:MAG: hypothetical protein LBK07_02105 [Tannerella sp.]|jgi:hypothetical protein|nr:hypothetical protein [Tannerella sp.]